MNPSAVEAASHGSRQEQLWAPHLALFFVQLFFGALPVMGKYVMGVMSPSALIFIRVSGAAVLLLGVLLARRVPIRLTWRDGGIVLILAVLGVVLNQGLFLEGLARSTAINAAVLMTAIPVLTTLIAILLSQERATFIKGIGIVVSLAGALLLMAVDRVELSGTHLLGNGLLFGNTLCYSLYLVLSRPVLERLSPLLVVTMAFVIGTVLLIPIGLPAVSELPLSRMSPALWMTAGGIVVFPTVLAYLLNLWALRRVSASVVVVYIYLQPLIAAMLSTWLLEEHLSLRTLVAASLIFLGVYLVSRARRLEARGG